MDNATRLQYLQAMGIDVWVPRLSAEPAEALPLGTPKPDTDLIPAIEKPVTVKRDIEHLVETIRSHEDNWERLQRDVAGCQKCDLCETRTQTVFGSGSKNPDWLLIGEAPGQSEDQQGLPFVGNAGQLLTEMLRACGLSRDEVFITNILKCRPPDNRDPKPNEIANCHDYLDRQLALLQPKIIVAVGRIAAQALLNTHVPIGKLRGKVHQFGSTPLVVIYHPAYLLRSLSEKRNAWLDLQLAIQTYNNNKG
jgi:DNA polymerase